MENKRSRGITFWGWAYIISGIIGLLGLIDPQPAIYTFGMSMFAVSVALCVVDLICGVFILKLNETARKTAILLSIIGIIFVPISLKLFLGHPTLREGMAKHSAERRQWITEHYKPEHQQKALADFEKTEAMSEKMVPIVFIVFGAVLPLLLAVIPIYFFTRPKVKEQFK